MKDSKIVESSTGHLPAMQCVFSGVLCAVILASAASVLLAQEVGERVGEPQTIPRQSRGLTELFDRVPAKDAAELADLKERLAGLGPDAIEELCRMLVAPGTGDDTKPRMVLHAMAIAAADPPAEQMRRDLVEVLSATVASDAVPAVKAFLIRQLQLAGGSDAIARLEEMLADDGLCSPAVQALITIGGDAAKAALRSALATAPDAASGPPDAACVTIIDALGVLRDEGSVSVLLRHAESEDAAVRLAALRALASIGDPAAADTLLEAMHVHAWQQHAEMTAAVLRFASRLDESGHREQAVRLFRQLSESEIGPEFSHVQAAALRGLAETLGRGAVEDVVAALGNADAEVRGAAMEVAIDLPGGSVTKAYVQRLKRAEAPVRASLLRVLTRRGEEAALPAARQALQDLDKDVRLAAVIAVATLGKVEAIEPLVGFLSTEDTAERKAAKAALVQIRGHAASKAIGRATADAPPAVLVALLEVLSDRRAAAELGAIYAATTHTDPTVRVAAVVAVGVLADAAAAPRLLRLLERVGGEREREAIELALSATCNRAETPAERAAQILAAIKPEDTAHYCSLLRAVGRVGGTDALGAVRTALTDPRDRVREAAVRGLNEWPDAEAAEAAIAFARGAKDLTHHVLAMRAYARLVSLDGDRPKDATLAMYIAGIDVARRPEEKKLILSKLGDVHAPQTVSTLAPYLKDEVLGPEAASATISVAGGLLPADWVVARQAVQIVLDATETEAVRRRAEEMMERVEGYTDFITDWAVAGPFTEEGKKGHELLEVAFPPEQAGEADVAWHRQPITEDRARYWFMDLNKEFGGPHRAAYLRTQIHSPTAQAVLLELGSDDGLKVWLESKLVHTFGEPRSCRRGEDKVEVFLKQGWNELLLKVTNGGGGWGACARVRRPDGSPLEGLTVDPAMKE